MPTVAGILDIASGIFQLIFTAIGMIIIVIGVITYFPLGSLIWFILLYTIVTTALALIGGIYALKRRKWGLALAGSIAAIFASMPLPFLGIAATIFIVLSRKEFV